MGTCKFCGKKTGLFSSSHQECEEKHAVGMAELDAVIKQYFQRNTGMANVISVLRRVRNSAYITKLDTIMLSSKSIDAYTSSLHFPITDQQIALVGDYMKSLHLSYAELNGLRSLTELSKKVVRGCIISYFVNGTSLATIQQQIQQITNKFPLNNDEISDCYWNVLNQAAERFLNNGILNDQQELLITNFSNTLGISLNNLPTAYSGKALSKVNQSIILKNLQKGIMPQQFFGSTIILGRGEQIIWTYHDVTMYREKIEKQYQGNRGGWSFRIMKGVTYHTGKTNLKPIEQSYMKNEGTGTLYITNKNVIFQGSFAAEKIPYTKMIGVTPYSDGIEVHKDGANQKRLTFQGFDSWFFMNVMSII